MRTVGEILRQQRRDLNLEVDQLAEKLKVKASYLKSLEEDNYQEIPGGMPIIAGILANYSQVLKLDPVKMGAIFRRDYISDSGGVLPEEFQGKNHYWTPAHTVGAIVVLVAVLAVAFYYSRSFLLSGPPVLKIKSPEEGEMIAGGQVTISGSVKRGDVVAINGEEVLLADDKTFKVVIDCQPGENLVLVEATNPSGEEEQLTRRFICQEE